jgi:predicted SnoaL-like aldol condensation-catalyzing enzyme
MKQILSLFTIGLALVLVSCGNDKTADTATSSSEKKDNSMAEKNLAATHVVTKAFETGDVSMIDSVVASDFVDHTDRGEKNRDSLKAMIVASKADTKDGKTEVIKELADNDYTFSWLRFTGTTSGKMGMPAGPYDMKSIEVVRFKDGMAVEHWNFMQPADMMKMMAQMGNMGQPKKK